jgi:glycosyltransferase involved in cell wall biosynthesis
MQDENAVRISIVIPTLNEEKLIGNLLSQFTDELKKKFNFEVIISDGGSKDSTLEIVKIAADKVVLNSDTKKQNISQGRNNGAKISQGDVLIFLNADTGIGNIEQFFVKVNELMKVNNIAAVACPVKIFPSEEKISDILFHFVYNNYVWFLNKTIMGMGRGECHIIKRESFFEAGGYDEKLAAGEDFDLYKRLRKKGKVFFCRGLEIFESPRRYRKYGYRKVFMDWTKNAISITLLKRSISKEWEAVR